MPAWWHRKSRSKSKAKPGAGPVSAASSPRKSADLESPWPSPSPTPRGREKSRSLDSPGSAAAARARCAAAAGHRTVGYKLPMPVEDAEPPETVETLYEDVAAAAAADGDVCSSPEESSVFSVGSSDEAQDQHGFRSMDPVVFARGRNMPSDSDRLLNEDKHIMSCSMPREHQKFFEIPVSSVREHHLHSDEPSTSETSCSRGRMVSEDLFAPRTRSLSPVPKGHAFALSNGNSRDFGFGPRSPVRMMDGLRSPPHPLPLPPGSGSPLHPSSAACSTLPAASATFSPLHPAAAAASSLPPTHSSCSPLPSSPSSCPPLPASPTTSSQSQSQWKKGKLLGSGTFGQVYLGFNRYHIFCPFYVMETLCYHVNESGQFCAIKEVQVIMDDPHSKERLKQLNQEIDMLRQLSHPNIVQYHGSDLTDDTLSIYLEYVSGGSIHKLLREYGPFKEPVIRNYTGQILAGLAYLHGRNTVHRDIKGANILVGPNGEVKLADFGMAKHISSFAEIRSFKGSPYWMAPEVIMNSKGYSLAVDIWSLGCTIIEMATARPPWHQYEGVAAIFKIANSKDIPEIPDSFSEEGKNFLQLCLKRNPASRASAAQLMDHPFVQDHPAVKAAKSVQQGIAITEDYYSSEGYRTESERFYWIFHCCPFTAQVPNVPLPSLACTVSRNFDRQRLLYSSPIPGRTNMSMPVSPCSSPLRQFKQTNRSCYPSPPHPMLSPGAGYNTLSYTQNQTRRSSAPAPAISDPWDVGHLKLQSPYGSPKRF
ncbi:Mitogen-activated protein kinase kinase kinase YODA [Dichanthelium oligosanthes]|uniref:mitogen-activated protein kinase kinase kinase n=1 Tax=Dichanthelium oligosanthes TaxID=888268 RepID=A0A1E5VXW4_9POAL|nr:Mitogen-activated protein kinase kinase kinase YODA [Dichanthelium oligosanthes]